MLEKSCSAPQDDSMLEPKQLRTGSLSSLTDAGGFFSESDALNSALLVCLFVIRDAKFSGFGSTIAGPPTQSACAKQLQNFIDAARQYVALVNSNDVADSEFVVKLQRAGQQIAKTALTVFLKQQGSIIDHVTDSEAIVETTSFLF
ncbi:hypothetical protein N7520_001958 [Penicillium odoratum]|uniref:uncharacterized protein n=1 Tax=Penicillium odoratum TaxID=1167516 RepID=UPI0025497EDC|nr:uncharacterized protein N7520_001958 [Penicillium odoratum]KAJ5778712.1 hypothetical protein N7520_001958 [Penicillium odoratum]